MVGRGYVCVVTATENEELSLNQLLKYHDQW